MTMNQGYTEASFFGRMKLQPNGCLHWPNKSPKDGYGRLSFQRRTVLAHRLAWELTNGAIPEGMDVLHACDNPPCCNVAHLSLGTHAENMRDMACKGRGAKKLTAEIVLLIKQAVAEGALHKDVAARFGISRRNVGHIVAGTKWGWVTDARA